MPTSKDNRFTPNVQFRTQRDAAKHASWNAHFHGCTRAAISALELLAKNNPDRWVYITVGGLTRMCNARFLKKGTKGFSTSAYEKSLKLLRELSVISRKHGAAPDGIEQEGFIISPHTSLCRLYPKSCNYVGLDGATGTWMIRDGKGTWVSEATRYSGDDGALVQERAVPITVMHTVIENDTVRTNSEAIPSQLRADSGAVPEQIRAEYGDRYGDDHGIDSAEPNANADVSIARSSNFPQRKAPAAKRNVLNCSNGSNGYNTHNASNPSAAQQADEEAKACVVWLVRQFVGMDTGIAPNMTAKHSRDITAIAVEHGRERFERGAAAWLQEQPWMKLKGDTLWPFSSFAASFPGYLATDVQIKTKKKLTEEEIERVNEIAKKAHYQQWGLNEDGSSKHQQEPGAEGFTDVGNDDPGVAGF